MLLRKCDDGKTDLLSHPRGNVNFTRQPEFHRVANIDLARYSNARAGLKEGLIVATIWADQDTDPLAHSHLLTGLTCKYTEGPFLVIRVSQKSTVAQAVSEHSSGPCYGGDGIDSWTVFLSESRRGPKE